VLRLDAGVLLDLELLSFAATSALVRPETFAAATF
jgi:hypothetical protein